HTRLQGDWSSDVCSSDLEALYVERGSPISGWFAGLLHRLLENEPAVTGLLARGGNPFPDHGPRLVRAVLYEYEFTTFEERRATRSEERRVGEECRGRWGG